ncbi:MAG: DNA translocase FtsK [Candidatus Aminicenantes bacterium]|nr:DNA translocase FtsK [Candidatus Aminicenantes bacterium]
MSTSIRRKNNSSSSRKNRGKKKVRTFEILGLVLASLALFLLVSLASYHASDVARHVGTEGKIRNLGGRLGAVLAEGLIQGLGFFAVLIPAALIVWVAASLAGVSAGRLAVRYGAALVLTLILSALTTMIFPQAAFRGGTFPSGGLLGDSLSYVLVRNLGPTGSYIFLILALLVFLSLTVGLTPSKIIRFLSGTARLASREVRIKITERRRPDKTDAAEGNGFGAPESIPDVRKNRDRSPTAASDRIPEGSASSPMVIRRSSVSGSASVPQQQLRLPEVEPPAAYEFPPFTLLDPGQPVEKIDKEELLEKKRRIEEKLREFRVEGEVRECHPGPIITTYEFYPYPGIKVSQVASLAEDLSLALGAESVRIQRIPGKSSLGVEIPNNKREIIKLRDILQSEKFINSPSKLTFALGKTVHDDVYVTDLSIMPHLLIAGATGSGKSVALNALIASILYKAAPQEVKLVLIDPKRLEFSLYDGIPHLFAPVITDPKKAGAVLMDAIKKMEDRYHKLHNLKVRNIEQYNQQVKQIREEKGRKLTEEEKTQLKPLPYIIIIIDELAELMMVAAQDVEYCIGRLAQLARAVGIHLILATQRPSTDVITGTIKNNFSSRIAFRVPSQVDSRTIIDAAGAEKLLGQGDMLFIPPNFPRITRLHCAFISMPEVRRLVKFVKEQGAPEYDEKIIRVIKSTSDHDWGDLGEKDELYDKAVEVILNAGQASVSFLQRRLKLGYARAARIIDQMEQEGILGPGEGSKPREILVDSKSYLEAAEKTRKLS